MSDGNRENFGAVDCRIGFLVLDEVNVVQQIICLLVAENIGEALKSEQLLWRVPNEIVGVLTWWAYFNAWILLFYELVGFGL